MQRDAPSLRTAKPKATVAPAPLVAFLDTLSEGPLHGCDTAAVVVVVLVLGVLVVGGRDVVVELVVAGERVVVLSFAADGVVLHAVRMVPATSAARTAVGRGRLATRRETPRRVTTISSAVSPMSAADQGNKPRSLTASPTRSRASATEARRKVTFRSRERCQHAWNAVSMILRSLSATTCSSQAKPCLDCAHSK